MCCQRYILIGLALAFAPAFASAQDKSDGELEDARIIRRPAVLAAGAATVDFRIACRGRETQAFFNQALVALHALETRAADRSFYQAAVLEPDCAMAWWGLALANIENRVLARHYLDQAAAHAARGAERERRWVAVLERALQEGAAEEDRRSQVVQALSRMTVEDPSDHEAATLLVRQLVSNRDAGMPVPLPAAVDALIAQVLRERPHHPIAVYRLLLWEREQPQRVAENIEPVRRLLPDSPRVQTLAGRIYARLHRTAPAIECFTASLALARRALAVDRVGPLDVAGYGENLDLLITQLRVEGRVAEATAYARHLIALPSVAPVDEGAADGPAPGMERMAAGGLAVAPFASDNTDATAIGQRHRLGMLVEYQRWDELAMAAESAELESTRPEVQGLRIHALGLAEFARGDRAGLEARREALAAVFNRVRATTSAHGFNGEREALLARLQSLGRELELCLQLLDLSPVPAGAPNVAGTAGRMVAAYGRVGETERAVAAARRRAGDPAAPASALLDLVQLLDFSGQHEEAKTQLAALRHRFPRCDADLAGVGAERSGRAGGGRLAVELSPTPAPTWRLPDQHGRQIEPGQFPNRPMLLVFYRGAGCPHCIDQLRALAPLTAEFEQAGITLFGVSTDTVAGLRESYGAVGAKTALPFQLVSDHALTTFRDYGAIDVRTGQALHGLFLIDGQGRIRWQAISAEPFMAVKSLLAEARRTLPLWAGTRSALARASAGSP